MVVVDIDGLPVVFPYPSLYPEQLEYMKLLKKALDAGGHALLEMPSGTGKTQTLLSLITAYLTQKRINGLNNNIRKFVYCTRTVEEMQKVLEEMKVLVASRERELGIRNDLLTVGLASRRHLCVHPTVSQMEQSSIDSGCRALTSSWVRMTSEQRPDSVSSCKYFETYEKEGLEGTLQPGVYALDDLRAYGLSRQWCPYFLSRYTLSIANILVYSYHYLLDPKVANFVSADLPSDSIIVFDEAHNIDNVCIEALSVDLESSKLKAASQNISRLNASISSMKEEAASKLQNEYVRLVSGLSTSLESSAQNDPSHRHSILNSDDIPRAPILPDTIVNEAIPESIRKAEEFISFVEKLITFLQNRTMSETVTHHEAEPFIRDLSRFCSINDERVFQSAYKRLISLLMTINASGWYEYYPLLSVCDFVTLLGTYQKEAMAIIMEPYNEFTGERNPVLRLACLDASLAIRWVMNKFRNVVITSGTLSPLDTYPRMMDFKVVVSASVNMSLERKCVCPLIMTKGSDQVPLSSMYNDRQTEDIPRNYGQSLLELSQHVPDGIVVFFVSYVFMQQVVKVWSNNENPEITILDELRSHKLVFVETQDPLEASLAIQNYKTACDSGRGAILLSVARGRAAEGIDFDGQYGRAVILFGVPFQYTESRVLKARLQFLSEKYQIREDDFLVFDAMRQAAQCSGRVIRNKNDYGIVIFADKRFARGKLRNKLPLWIAQFLTLDCLDLDTGSVLAHSRSFLLEMAQTPATYERLNEEQVKEVEFFS